MSRLENPEEAERPTSSQRPVSRKGPGAVADAGKAGATLSQSQGSGANLDEGGSEPVAVKRTVDELMQDHVDFLATCLKECMLTNSKLLRVSLTFPLLSTLSN